MVEIVIVFVVTITDALRDRWHGELGDTGPFFDWTKKQWRWHLVKWIAFYTPLVYVVARAQLELVWLLVLSVFSFFLWRLVYSKGLF